MITLYHGDDFVTSRANFNKEKDLNSIAIDVTDVDKNLLNQLLSESSLFTEHKKIFIENLFNKKGLKNFEDILSLIKTAKHLDIFIWSDKEIGKLQTKDFPKFLEQKYKIPQTIFAFVDQIKPTNTRNSLLFHDVLKNSEPEFIFSMILRQFRLMIGLMSSSKQSIDEIKRIQSWQMVKLKNQASLFGIDNLKKNYKKLYEIDKNLKTGASNLNIIQAIDMFLLEI